VAAGTTTGGRPKVRAKLKEKDHKYREALEDLESLLQRDPEDRQAWIEVANLYRVIGSYQRSRESIGQLSSLGDQAAVLVATAPLKAVTGDARQAYDALTKFLESSDGAQSKLRPWAVAMQGDIAASLGQFETADKHYREALAIDGGSLHLKRAYADFLLDHQHPQPVLKLLVEHESDNGCLLLMAIAANRMGMKERAAALKSKMAVRFEEIRLRGNQPHGRFESRYELELNDNPEKALEVALQNWELQKENRDARAVLESALAAKNFAAAASTIEFVKSSGNEDVAMTQLVRALEKL
jgi:tetratricopeptide (TPR) repeat protein